MVGIRHKWRQFRPKHSPAQHAKSYEMLDLLEDANHAYDFTQTLKKRTLPKEEWGESDRLHAQLIAQTPRAVLAQQQMDEHKHGFHNREKRLYELIDFNDSFVAYILALPDEHIPGIVERLHADMKKFCKRLKTPMFTDRQFEAIVHGLSREIAVYRGAKVLGFGASMTSRTEDAFGIDMVIEDPASGKQANIDCKTSRAYHYKLEDFMKQGRITPKEADAAEQRDFVTVINSLDGQAVPVTTVCIRSERLGDIINFHFSFTNELEALLRDVLDSL